MSTPPVTHPAPVAVETPAEAAAVAKATAAAELADHNLVTAHTGANQSAALKALIAESEKEVGD